MKRKSGRRVVMIPRLTGEERTKKGRADVQSAKEKREKAISLKTESALWSLVDVVSKQVDLLTWLEMGGPEALKFLECLHQGQWHPLLRTWWARKATISDEADTARASPPPPGRSHVHRPPEARAQRRGGTEYCRCGAGAGPWCIS